MSLGVVGVAAGSVALASGAIAVGSWRALVRTGNPAIRFFVVAFAILSVKNAVKAYVALADVPETYALESLFSVADLAAVLLIAWPLLPWRSRA